MIGWINCTLLAGALVALTACSTPPLERTGGVIDVFPITHKYLLSFENHSFGDAKEGVKTFIKNNRRMILRNDIKLSYTTAKGEELAKFTESYLYSMGYSPQRLSLLALEAQNHFDFELILLDFQVQESECTRARIGEYFLSDNGCFSENARWLSMENPEKMLPSKPSFSSSGMKE